MITPLCLQLSRAKGFNLQAASLALNGLEAVSVARPSPFGNPFIVSKHGIQACCVELFTGMLAIGPAITHGRPPSEQIEARARILSGIQSLRGKNLACWCKPGALCHADVLLEIANRPICEEVK